MNTQNYYIIIMVHELVPLFIFICMQIWLIFELIHELVIHIHGMFITFKSIFMGCSWNYYSYPQKFMGCEIHIHGIHGFFIAIHIHEYELYDHEFPWAIWIPSSNSFRSSKNLPKRRDWFGWKPMTSVLKSWLFHRQLSLPQDLLARHVTDTVSHWDNIQIL